MSDKIGCDFAFKPYPDIGALKTAGIRFVGRYASGQAGKDITPAEARAYREAGIDVVLFNETTGTSILTGGEAGGAFDATTADEIAKACGLPGCPIYFTDDSNSPLPDDERIAAYLRGAAAKIGKDRVGGYGGLAFVSYVLDHDLVRFACQTVAWSGGIWDARVNIRQYYQVDIGGAHVDYDVAMKPDFGQFPRPAVHVPYRHLTTGRETFAEIASRRRTTVAHILGVSAGQYSANDLNELGDTLLPANVPYYTTNP